MVLWCQKAGGNWVCPSLKCCAGNMSTVMLLLILLNLPEPFKWWLSSTACARVRSKGPWQWHLLIRTRKGKHIVYCLSKSVLNFDILNPEHFVFNDSHMWILGREKFPLETVGIRGKNTDFDKNLSPNP